MTALEAFNHYTLLLSQSESSKRASENLAQHEQQAAIDAILSKAGKEKVGKDRNKGIKVVKTIARETKKRSVESVKEEVLGEDPLIYLQHAASLSHTESQIRLANHLLKSNPIEAIKLYEESESNEGYFNLGHIYWKGVEGVEKDEDQAVIYFEKAAENGDADSLYFLGVHFTSLPKITLAASLNHSGAQYYLALHNYSETGNTDTFKIELEKAAEENNEAMELIGESYLNGENGFPKNPSLALKYYKLSSSSGSATASVTLGALYYHGLPPSILKNKSEAFQYYQKAGELGSKDGWMNVAACYAEGEGVGKCEKTAKYIVETMVKDKG